MMKTWEGDKRLPRDCVQLSISEGELEQQEHMADIFTRWNIVLKLVNGSWETAVQSMLAWQDGFIDDDEKNK